MAVATPRTARPQPEDDKRMELTEHLGELRSRLIRIILYLVAGSTVCYYFFKPLYRLLFWPMEQAIKASGKPMQFLFIDFINPFFVVLEISVVAGLILTLPFITLELWGFIAPALTRQERKPLRFVAPAAFLLFLCGVALSYYVSRSAITWLISFVDYFPNAVLMQDPKKYVMFMLKIMGIFGLMFELPVVLGFLAHVGIVKSAAMKKYWRHAIVAIAFVGMLVTPTNDVMTMLMMVVPIFILYLGSIFLVQFIEKKRAQRTR